jgi:hypothetical protein
VSWSATAGKVSTTGAFTAPTVSTTTSVNITATSAADTTKKSTATVSVTPPATASVSILTSYLPGAQAGTAYSYALQANGGTTPYQWAVASGTLPAGFSLSSAGKLAGTTTQKGQFSFTAQVTDAGNHSATRSLSFSVLSPPTSSAGSYDGPAQLPQVLMQTAMANTPAPGSTIVVSAGTSIQSALNSAS